MFACLFKFVNEFLYVIQLVLLQMAAVARGHGGDGACDPPPPPRNLGSSHYAGKNFRIILLDHLYLVTCYFITCFH